MDLYRQQLIVCILLLFCKGCFSQNKSTKILHDYLFNDYSSAVRPVYNNSKTTNVILRLNVRNLLRMDTVEQLFTVTTWLKQTWTDEYLTWNPDDFYGIKRLNVPVEKLWTPDITLHDNSDLAFERYKQGTYVQLFPDGTVVWFVPFIFSASCIVSVKWFPFDTQVCEVVFGSWSYDGFEVDLNQEQSLDASTRRYLANGVWDLYDVSVKRTVVTYLCCPEPYPELHYLLVFNRHAAFYIYYMVLPCVFLSILSLLVFYLPPDCGEKLTLSITNLLALVVFQQIIASNMPPTSDDSPVIGTYFLCMIVMVCVSVIATGFIMHLSAISHKMPLWVKRLFLEFIPRILCMSIGPMIDENMVTINPSTTGYQNGIDISTAENGVETLKNNTHKTEPSLQVDFKDLRDANESLRYLKYDAIAKNAQTFEHFQWRRVSVVADRLLLAIFSVYMITCTFYLALQIFIGKDEEFDNVKDLLAGWGYDTTGADL